MKSTVYVGDQPIDNPCLKALLKSWTPKPTVISTIWTFGIFAAVMYIASIILFVYNAKIGTYTIQHYDTIQGCVQQGSICTLNVNIIQDLPGPVILQYGLTNFEQNNKKYMVSRSGNQLYGNIIDLQQAQRVCGRVVQNKDLGSNYNTSWNGTLLDPEAVANPCGYIAKSFFNDTYQLTFQNGTQIFLNETGISWPFDNGRKFRRAPNSSEIQWIDPVNEHFMVWMRVSSRTDFYKPWGIIKEGLKVGSYKLFIKINYNSGKYDSHKNIKFSSVGAIGSQNFTLPIVLSVFATVFVIGCIVFACKYKATKGKFGPKYL